MKRLYTAESVTEGHPDKLCDLIADSILDECLKFDPDSRVACEVLATKGMLLAAGEITSTHEFFALLYLAQHPSWVLSKEQIYEAVWKADPEHCGAAVANVVCSLRRKIGDGYIETVVGSGYRFVA